MLLCADNALIVSKNAEFTLRNELDKHFEQKEGSIAPPKMWAGGSVRKMQLDNGIEA